MWKKIKNYNYLVNEDGIIKNSKTNRILKQSNKSGYKIVCLSINNKSKTHYVHRLVAKTFIPNTNDKLQVNHIDGNKSNNKLENLEWCTPLENMIHAKKIGLKNDVGENNPNSKLTKKDVKHIKMLNKFYTQRELGKIFGVCQTQISKIIKNKRWNVISIGEA